MNKYFDERIIVNHDVSILPCPDWVWRRCEKKEGEEQNACAACLQSTGIEPGTSRMLSKCQLLYTTVIFFDK